MQAAAPGAAAGQTFIPCGGSASGFLQGSDVDVYTVDVPSGATGAIQGTLTSGDPGETLRIRVLDDRGLIEETCSNFAPFDSRGGPQTIEVSTCSGGQGDYRVNAVVISGGAANCGRQLLCGATPDGIELSEPGEVDSFRFPGDPGGEVELSVDDLDGRDSAYLLRVFDPDGRQVGRTCDDDLDVETDSSGDYTLLISACGSVSTGEYRIERFDDTCPRGPVITTMALLRDDGTFLRPTMFDLAGRPIYQSPLGRGTVIVEARVGASLRGVGASASTPGSLPAFQGIVGRNLGDGNPAVCDQGETPPGGVAATVPLTFRGDQASIDRINDFGCRVDDGAGAPVGRRDPLNSCERSSFSFVDPTTVIQFCAPIPLAEAFPFGDTVVAVRMADLDGVVGAVREMIVRVTGGAMPTATFTPTFIASATPTPTRTLRPTSPPPTRVPGPCTCDCNLDGEVRVSDLTKCVLIALGGAELSTCPIADTSGDGRVSIAELIDGVNNALYGCPPPAGTAGRARARW